MNKETVETYRTLQTLYETSITQCLTVKCLSL